jgi:hypothetical protein
MHGDRQVSTKNLARAIGAKSVEPCKPDVAQRHSGYLVGGTSPFGTRKAMPVYVEASVLALPSLLINGGRRGFPGRPCRRRPTARGLAFPGWPAPTAAQAAPDHRPSPTR